MVARTILLALVCFAVAANAGTLSGPVTGGERGSPFAAVDVADQGYLTEEYFLAGEATAYESAEGTHTQDGRWKTREAENKADFKTRLLVVRPEDPAAFNGTTIVFWLNVTAGFELGSASAEAMRGYAWVGVSAQKIGIDGFPQNPQGLKAWDSERYGSLVHPGDAYSYDIFTQAAMAVGPPQSRRLGPHGRPGGRAADRGRRFAVRRTSAQFDAEQLAALYPDSQHYLEAWNAALDRAVEQGLVLPEDAGPMREQAAAWATRLDANEADETP